LGNDRDARGLEDPIELFDRFLFCRSFHSKLFPVGGHRKKRDRRVTPIAPPKT
jgi:hypothetical protein